MEALVLTDNNGTLYPRLEIKISECPMQDQIINLLEKKDTTLGLRTVETIRLESR